MARKFVSPGVFTQEIDQSYLAQGVAAIGAAVIGRTKKGPAFVPTVVTDFNEFVTKFGDLDTNLQLPYAAKNYLKNGQALTVVRVLGSNDGNTTINNGWTGNVLGITGSLSSSTGNTGSMVLAFVHVPLTVTASLSGVGSGSTFTYRFTGSFGNYAGTASFLPSSPDYVGKVFNTDPAQVNTYGHYLYKNFQWAQELATASVTSGTNFVSASFTTTASLAGNYTRSTSPYVKSQAFGSQVYSLFYFESISAGQSSNTDVKVSIANILSSSNAPVDPYGTFDVIVRQWSDTDQRMVQLETFTNCNLNPNSTDYVARRIGNQKFTWDSTNRKNTVSGQFKNVSKYIRVEMASTNYPQQALPWGHAAYPENTVSNGVIVDVPWVSNNLDNSGNVEIGNIWGLDFSKSTVSERLKYMPDVTSASGTATGSEFSLSHVKSATLNNVNYCVYDATYTGTTPDNANTTNSLVAAARNGFTLAMYGGFDGWDLTDADPYSAPTAVAAQKAAIDTVGNPDEVDINILCVPGVTTTSVTDYARAVCNSRADCMAIIDIAGSSVSDAVGQLNGRGIDDNYAAAYYPDLVYSDTVNNALVQVKPSVAMLGAYAYNDRVKAAYFAPAGLNRGGLAQFGIVDVKDRLTFQDRNDLYENRINPIASFPNEGIVAFGQKTLQYRPSALDRVNVRRLLIYAKKTIASAAKYLLFEPNNQNTWQRFLNTVNPILEAVRINQGLERFKVVMDSSVNTPDLIDRNIMTGKIFLQPTKAAEYIDLSFIITSSGVQFGE